jgi:hypothetical protein
VQKHIGTGREHNSTTIAATIAGRKGEIIGTRGN